MIGTEGFSTGGRVPVPSPRTSVLSRVLSLSKPALSSVARDRPQAVSKHAGWNVEETSSAPMGEDLDGGTRESKLNSTFP